jgi:hypothetical protein
MIRLLTILFMLLLTAGAAEPQSSEDAEALALGRQILAVQRALGNPDKPESLKAVTALGTDSRYYAMVRGWLVQLLAGDESIAEAAGGKSGEAVAARIRFLRKAIRAIDLEK